MTLRRLSLFCVATALGACGAFPEVDAATSEAALDAPFPELRPVESLRATVPEEKIDDDTGDNLQSRADRLRARAAGLRGSVLDTRSRARLEQDVTIEDG